MLGRLLLILTLALAGCAARPGPEVLAPDAGALPEGARLVRVLTMTTRAPEANLPGAFGDFAPSGQAGWNTRSRCRLAIGRERLNGRIAMAAAPTGIS